MERVGLRQGILYAIALGVVAVVIFGLLHMRQPKPEQLNTYSSATYGFSAAYPEGFVVNENYSYTGFGDEGTAIPGVSFTVPPQYAQGTNLSSDSHVSVEVYRGTGTTCRAKVFLAGEQIDPNALNAQVNGAGAGNFYEESVYAIEGSSPCTAVRFLIHSTNINNYPEGAVREFNKAEVLQLFETIRRSVKLTR